MNKTGIEWCDYTWSPVTGCTRGCPYCYARRMAQRLRGRAGYPQDDPFRPTMHWDRLFEPEERLQPARIFVCSMGELFSPDVPDNWVEDVRHQCLHAPQHTFIFLTKNPHLLAKWNPWPDNAWVGVSAVADGDMTLALTNLAAVDAPVRFVSCEPLLGAITMRSHPMEGRCDWLIIGAQSGPGARQHWPHRDWVDELVEAADRAGVPVFLKDNLRQPFPSLTIRQEMPR